MQRPQGGPRDLTPPKLLQANPPNMTRNFNAKKIEMDFDEFFKLTNQYQEISISPTQEKLPEYNVRRKKLVIEFQDSLEKNTTYVINFGKAIADVNEANAMKNFTYVFSTGPHIDSLSISGNVTNTQTLQKEKDVSVLLFPLSKDSLFYSKKKPSIFATTDSSGNFSLNNLREDSYRIYAIKEASPNRVYDNEAELVAFIKDTIRLTKDTSNIQLRLFQQDPENFRFVERRFDVDGKILMVFNKRLFKPSVKIISPAGLDNQKMVEFSKTRDTAYIFMRNMDFDSVSVAVSDNNSPIDTTTLRKNRKESFQKGITFSYNISSDNKLRPSNDLLLTPSLPVESINPAMITLKEDSAVVSNFQIVKDTSSVRRLVMRYRWKQDVSYQLTFDEGAFTDIYGNKNKKALKKFTIDKPENYSMLTLKVSVPDPTKQYIVEIFRDEKNLIRTDIITKNSSIVYNNFPTAKYTVRVIYDANKNGRWDSGNVRQMRQPENIWIYDKEITLRANWEAEEAITIPKEPVIP
ncbi:Ig-like domain-containing protein [Mucilaginibacter limnophilus]|nr:Ig-like domain-containing protein [Mucilaginibacter limnophilus]